MASRPRVLQPPQADQNSLQEIQIQRILDQNRVRFPQSQLLRCVNFYQRAVEPGEIQRHGPLTESMYRQRAHARKQRSRLGTGSR